MWRRNEPTEVALARIRARTARTTVRWNASKRIVPAVAASVCGIFTTERVVTESSSGANVWLIVVVAVMALGLGACGVKIWWDRRAKERQRGIITDLEDQNRTLVREAGELAGQIAATKNQTEEPPGS